MKYLFIETCLPKKIEEIISIYKKILEQNNNKSKNTIILVANSMTRLKYERKLNLEFSEELKIITYSNFIKKEIIKFWPLITENCKSIDKKTIVPTFISNSLGQYIINDKVNKKRNLEGYFQDITSTNRNIANSINTNINKASQALLDFKTIGEKIYLSKKNRDSIMKFSYSQMDEIINYYVDSLLSNSMLDDSICIYLYNNFLLTNEGYINHLKNEIEYLIVDSLENSTTAEVDFISRISEFTKETYIYFNKSRDYSVFNNIDIDYINEKIVNSLETNHKTEIKNIGLEDIYLINTKINLNEVSQLYSEMIEEATSKVVDLVKNGVKPKDIAIISPINNTVLDYQINNILRAKNIEVFNTKKDKKIVDYPYANALVVASCIFYDFIELVKEEEHISFIEILLDVNRVQALKIFRNKELSESYMSLINHIKSQKNKDTKMSEFLIKFYIDKMLNLKEGKENVKVCKQIINESEIFIQNISMLGLDKNKDKEKIFIEALQTTINDYYSVAEIEELEKTNSVLITTPYSYISYNLDRPIQLWMDIGSNAWNMKIEKDISNIIVLRKSFKENRIYTDAMEEGFKKYYLYNMIYNLLVNAKQVYAYKSEYTVNGYMQESILYSLLLKILGKAGEYNE
ncbi:hypothetical protein [Romboutsia sp.]|uniref:hypothetical protein n=1 Tax=Romboutsia sp. TaxID=1965302 RepID=UPI003F2FA532